MATATDLMVTDYARDLLERLREAKAKAVRTDDAFDAGRKLGLYEALSMLVNRTGSFNIPAELLGLNGIDPDEFL